MTLSNNESYTVKELQGMAKDYNIKGYSKLRKADLCDEIIKCMVVTFCELSAPAAKSDWQSFTSFVGMGSFTVDDEPAVEVIDEVEEDDTAYTIVYEDYNVVIDYKNNQYTYSIDGEYPDVWYSTFEEAYGEATEEIDELVSMINLAPVDEPAPELTGQYCDIDFKAWYVAANYTNEEQSTYWFNWELAYVAAKNRMVANIQIKEAPANDPCTDGYRFAFECWLSNEAESVSHVPNNHLQNYFDSILEAAIDDYAYYYEMNLDIDYCFNFDLCSNFYEKGYLQCDIPLECEQIEVQSVNTSLVIFEAAKAMLACLTRAFDIVSQYWYLHPSYGINNVGIGFMKAYEAWLSYTDGGDETYFAELFQYTYQYYASRGMQLDINYATNLFKGELLACPVPDWYSYSR